jgi:predicted transcriptional regulator of viral defense system
MRGVHGKVDTANHAVARIAARQHGVVTIGQLRAAGISDHAVRWRVRTGLLHRVHRGVYAPGHAGLAERGRWMGAVLACGPGAVLSHGCAAVLWGMLRSADDEVHVSVPSGNGRRAQPGIRLHRRPSLARGDSTTRRLGIPVTTPARTLADLPGTMPSRLVRRGGRRS